MVTDIKTKRRSRLNVRTVAFFVRIKMDMHSMKNVYYDYPITQDLLKLFNETMYSEDNTDSETHYVLVTEGEESEEELY